MLQSLMRLSFSAGLQKYFIAMASSSTACKAIKMATVYHDEEKKTLSLRLQYTNPENRIDRFFNFHRPLYHRCSLLLNRMSISINKEVIKRNKKDNLSKVIAPIHIISKDNSKIDADVLSCEDVFVKNSENYSLVIDDILYNIEVNPPRICELAMPKENIMVGYLLYPNKIVQMYNDPEETKYTWFKTKDSYESYEEAKAASHNWEYAGQGYSILTLQEDINKLYKLVATPYAGNRKGADYESVAKVLVSASPGPCPFEKRHHYTRNCLDEAGLRVVSYNLLADLYADSNYSRTKLFPTCPPYALAIEYRKQLIIKELLGYNADLICLQEVDEKFFNRDYEPMLLKGRLKGVFNRKGTSCEGLATFFNPNKLTLRHRLSFKLGSELMENPLFQEISSNLKSNETLFELITKRPNILQVCVFEDKNCPSRMLMSANTHLYFDPLSDHIRLLQAGLSLTLVRQLIEVYQTQEKKTVSLIFCGDFNSVPENAIYRLMTTQFIDKDDVDWHSKPQEEIDGISFSHDLELDSACGKPQYTNYVIDFNGCLDYIYYQTDTFDVSQVVPMPSHEEVTEHVALPSVNFPSDHIALVADLKWKEKSNG